jgi:3-carboxy-cis,cis-muconate cycloisomerase
VSDPAEPESGLFGDLFSSTAVAREVSDAAWLQALLDAEAALARAQAANGLVPADAAAAISAACSADRFDAKSLGQRAGLAGNPVVPLVHDLRALVGSDVGRYVHLGATSQDIIDTAMMLVARRALEAVLEALAAVADECAALAAAHRDTIIAGRTLMQDAAPTTFGLKAAGWLVAVDEARVRLTQVRDERLAVQLGGAVGNLAALDSAGPAVAVAFGGELHLNLPTVPWHTNRVRVAELASALGVVCGVLGKLATDLILLAQTEVAEAHAQLDGGSSAMPQKRNPTNAILTVAASRRAPGLVSTLLTTLVQEHERAAGSWHAEWATLTELLAITGGAAAHSQVALDGLVVDATQMRRHVVDNDGLMAEAVAWLLGRSMGSDEAHELVRTCTTTADARHIPLRTALLEDARVNTAISAADLDAALDPHRYLGGVSEMIDAALRAHRHADAARGAG